MDVSKVIGRLVIPFDAGVPSTPWEPIVRVSCPELKPSPLNCIANVVAPLLALSVLIVAITPTMEVADAGTCTLAVVLWP
jgi:hypothetical protein